MMYAPVVIFAYNRSRQLQETLEALGRNEAAEKTDVFIFSDGPKNEEDAVKVEQTREVIERYQYKNNFKSFTVYGYRENQGLAKSVIAGVTKVIQQYEKAIVLEDDLITSPDFISYMNAGLEYYGNDEKVGAISGFSSISVKKGKCLNGIYKSRTGNSCGWATWLRVWEQVDWDVSDYSIYRSEAKMIQKFNSIQYGISDILDKQMAGFIDSWAVRWDYHFFKNDLWTIYPVASKIQNVGFGKEGSTSRNRFDKRRKIRAKRLPFKMVEKEILPDLTSDTCNYFKVGIMEKLLDWLQKLKK